MADSGIHLLQHQLKVGQDEQTRRLQARIDDGRTTWKLSSMARKPSSLRCDCSRSRDQAWRVVTDHARSWV